MVEEEGKGAQELGLGDEELAVPGGAGGDVGDDMADGDDDFGGWRDVADAGVGGGGGGESFVAFVRVEDLGSEFAGENVKDFVLAEFAE